MYQMAEVTSILFWVLSHNQLCRCNRFALIRKDETFFTTIILCCFSSKRSTPDVVPCPSSCISSLNKKKSFRLSHFVSFGFNHIIQCLPPQEKIKMRLGLFVSAKHDSVTLDILSMLMDSLNLELRFYCQLAMLMLDLIYASNFLRGTYNLIPISNPLMIL